MRWWSARSIAVGAVCFIGGGALVKLYAVSVSAHTPTVVIEELREGEGVTVRDGSLSIQSVVSRQKECRTVTDRWVLLRNARGDITDFWAVSSPPIPPIPVGQTTRYTIHLDLPRGIVVPNDGSKLFYRARYQDQCSLLPEWLTSPVRQTSDIPLNIAAGVTP